MVNIIGYGQTPDGVNIVITPEKKSHILDGYKLSKVFISAYLHSREDMDELIDFLKISREGFSRIG